jgi:hypothetical protein
MDESWCTKAYSGFAEGYQFHLVSSGIAKTFHINSKNGTNFISF